MQITVGVGVFAFNSEGQFVVGERKGSHGADTLALPGGHLEVGETFEACAVREAQEETGLVMRDVRFLTAIDDIDVQKGKHFVVIVMGGLVDDQQPKLMEPDKCGGWEWTTWEEMQNHGTPLFAPIRKLLEHRPSFHPRQYFN